MNLRCVDRFVWAILVAIAMAGVLYSPPARAQTCSNDAQCPAQSWCSASQGKCVPKLANGTPLPVDPGHVNPTLTGLCTAQVGALVCLSAICNTNNNTCGPQVALLTIAPTASATTQVGQSYSQTNVASGGTPSYIYSLASGTLPPGTTLNTSTGTVSGTPTTSGPFSYAIMVTDSGTQTATTSTISGTIASVTLTIVSTASAATQVGQSYSQTNVASGGTPSYVYSLTSGTLPAGTTLNTSTGTVSGTPTTSGPFSYAITATDSGTQTATTSTISGTIAPVTLTIVSTASATTQVGQSYSQTNVASGGTPSYVYSLASGTLPPGTTLNTSTGTVSGTPTTSGPFSYAITVTDSGIQAATTTAISGTIASVTLTIVSTASSTTQVGQSYSQTNVASGGTPSYIYSLASGTLPPGTTLNTSTGTVSGTPTTSGPFSYAIKVTDSGTQTATTSTVSGTIAPVAPTCSNDAQCPAQSWCSASQSKCVPKLANGTPLPVDPGHVNPTLTGLCTAQVGALVCLSAICNTNNNTCGPQVALLTIAPTASATTQVGQSYSQTNVASGGTPSYVYSLTSGTLPPGTRLNTSTGTVSGTPTTSGPFSYAITVTDSGTQTATTSTISGTIAPVIPVTLTIVSTASAATQVGQSYSQTNVASGGTPSYVYSLASGTLPPGTTLNTSTGTVSGTPTTSGPFSYAIKVTDSGTQTATTSTISGTVAPVTLTITPTASSTTLVGQSYSQTNVASGGTPSYVYSLASGTLPPGTTLNTSTGTVSGTPTTSGPFSYAIKVTDSGTQTATTSTISGTVAPVTLTITPTASSTTQVGQSYSQTNVASGGTPSYVYSLASGTLPPGTRLNTSTGTVSGTPTTSGPFSYAIKVTDSGTQAATTSTISGTIGGVSLDSQHLRQMQIQGTQTSAQISGQAIAGATGDAIDAGFSDSVTAVKPNGSGFTYNFAADEPTDPRGASASDGAKNFVAAPDRNTSQLMDEEFAALGYAGITKAPPKSPVVQRDWLGWIDVRGISLNNNTPGADLSGNQLNVTAGLTRKLTPDFLIGGFAGYEHLDFNSDALNSRLKGDGWTAGGYLGWRLTQSLRFDMTLARSGIAYNDISGMAAATFPGDRWIASGGLTGTYHLQALVLQPSAKVYALWEHDGAYTDSLGIAQPINNFSTGRASAGTKVSYPLEWTSAIALGPYAGVYGDYYFTGNNATVAGVPTPALLLQGWSARLLAGLDMKFRNGGVISVGGELGGLGSNSNTTIWTYKARGSVPF